MYAKRKSLNDGLDLDVEYSPSRNTKRFQEYEKPDEKVIENFLQISRKETERVRSKYQTRLDVPYGGNDDRNDNRLLDIYYKGEEKDSPLFVFIHGGYWREMDKNTAGSFVAPLVERGYRVAVVDYNLCPTVTLEELVNQTLDFYEWLFKYANETNGSSVSICGHSAGAHLAALLLYSSRFTHTLGSDKIMAIFLIGGVYDLRELWQLSSVNPENIFSLDIEKAMKLSPILWDIDQKVVEFFIQQNIQIHLLVGENESPTFIGQSQTFYKKIKDLGFPAKCKVFDKYDHFDIMEEAAIDDSQICRYILEAICKKNVT